MTDTDILAFVKARLDEDQKIAEAATAGPWTAAYDYGDYKIEPNVAGSGYEYGGVYESQDADHIALHDPSRVLREAAAKRRVLERHKPVPGEEHIICDIDSFVGHDDTEGRYGDPYPCADVRALASIYSDHPDYNPSWTVE